MFGRLQVAVVVPAWNESDKIENTISSIPHFVDDIILVDDGSVDGTGAAAIRTGRASLHVVRHDVNSGVGRAIATGYAHALALGATAVAVMAGDAQMDPQNLAALLAPIEAGQVDYAKGNRFGWPGCFRVMPFFRYVGNVILSWLTRLALGTRQIFDSQCGYTAITREALLNVDLSGLLPRYGYPNDLLLRLRQSGARMVDVPVRPVYGPSWRSGVRPWMVIHPIGLLLMRALWRRLVDDDSRGLGVPLKGEGNSAGTVNINEGRRFARRRAHDVVPMRGG